MAVAQLSRGSPRLQKQAAAKRPLRLRPQVGPVNHNGRPAFEASQVADGGHQGALGLDGVKARIREEAKEEFLRRLVVALGHSEHTRACH